MDKQELAEKRRSDLKCLSVGSVWEKAKYLAKQQGLSISGYFRKLILNKYRKEKKKEEVSGE